MNETLSLLFIMGCVFLPIIFQPRVIEVQVETIKYIPKDTQENKTSRIYQDCLDSLVSLGLKKKAAKQRTNELFAKKQYVKVEEFLIDAYKI